MITAQEQFTNMINAISRIIRAKVSLYDGDTLLSTFSYDGALQSFNIERIGTENKFFGYGISQKLTLNLRDKERSINVVKGQVLEVFFGVNDEYVSTCPFFFRR